MFKKVERYLSLNKSVKSSRRGSTGTFTKNKSCPPSMTTTATKKHQVAPTGCFSVYVGPDRERFVIKTEYVNHPLFKMLLEDAESEYGFNCDGPLQLPCDVDLFYKVLAEMDSGREFDDDDIGCGYAPCTPFSPARRLGKRGMAKGYGPYALLAPPSLLKINQPWK